MGRKRKKEEKKEGKKKEKEEEKRGKSVLLYSIDNLPFVVYVLPIFNMVNKLYFPPNVLLYVEGIINVLGACPKQKPPIAWSLKMENRRCDRSET